MDSLRTTHLVRTGGSGAQDPSCSLARITIFLRLYRLVVGS